MNRIKGDLHIHTTVSDSDYNIEEVILKAVKSGVTHMAITDHDTTLGGEKAIALGKKHGVKVVSGIEVSAYDEKRDTKVHILGYNLRGGSVKKLCEPLLKQRHSTSIKMHEIIVKQGYGISWKEVMEYAGDTGVFKQHIMLALIKKGYTDRIYGDLYKRLFKGDGEANIPLTYPTALDIVRAIKRDGGVAVIAHPAQLGNEDLIPELKEVGLDGIEVYHPDHSEAQVDNLLKIAQINNLLVSGGSDFHGNMGQGKVDLGAYGPSDKMIKKIFEGE